MPPFDDSELFTSGPQRLSGVAPGMNTSVFTAVRMTIYRSGIPKLRSANPIAMIKHTGTVDAAYRKIRLFSL